METERDVVTIGNHRAWIEEPYALVFQMNGDVTGEEQAQMLDMLDLIGGGQGPVIIMQDLSKGGAFTQAARKTIMNDKRTQRVATAINIGANFHMRVLLAMIGKTMKVFNPSEAETILVKDEAEARTLLASERERLQKKQG